MKDKIKILHFFWSGEAGGRENLVYLLMKEQLKDEDIEISILLGERKGYYIKLIEDLGIDIYYLPFGKNELSIKNLKYTVKLLLKYDIIHLHSVNLIMIFSIILTNSRSIFTFHGKRVFISKSFKDYLTGKFK